MKKSIWIVKPVLILLTVTCVALTLVSWFLDRRLFIIELILTLAVLIYSVVRLRRMQRDMSRYIHTIQNSLDVAHQKTLYMFPFPVFVVSEQQEIVWYNDSFCMQVLGGEDSYGVRVSTLFEGLDARRVCEDKTHADIAFKSRLYTVHGEVNDCEGVRLYVMFFIDNTALKRQAMEYRDSRPVYMAIMIDNYDELMQNSRDSEKAQIIGMVESHVEKFIGDAAGVFKKVERDKFIAFVEERHLQEMIEDRFSILEQVKSVLPGERMPPTLSIGIGRGAKNFAECEISARQALDMALGRGGDQVAIKSEDGFEFYGGVSSGFEKRTKVKTRIVANALTELIENSDNVIVMGHRFADLDCLGAAVGVMRGARMLGKEAVIAIKKDKNLAAPLLDRLSESEDYKNAFLEPEQALEIITPRSLLIIVDTHNLGVVESLEVYTACETVVVIDHHRKMVNYIENAVIFYHEPYASSASEMVAELLQYFGDRCKLGRLEAEAMLAGIMLDTKNFVIKAGVRTFEAAAYLKRLGADTVEVRKLFSSSMDSYQRKTRLVSAAEIYHNCAIATAVGTADDIRIVAPQAADELLNISDVDASFVLYETPKGVSISARSMGAMNVQLLMEKFGGGGHHTMAGAQIDGESVEKVRQSLLEAIDRYRDREHA